MCEQKPYIICGMANINKFYWHKSYPAKCEHSLYEHNNNAALHLQAIRAIFGCFAKNGFREMIKMPWKDFYYHKVTLLLISLFFPLALIFVLLISINI